VVIKRKKGAEGVLLLLFGRDGVVAADDKCAVGAGIERAGVSFFLSFSFSGCGVERGSGSRKKRKREKKMQQGEC